MKRVVHFEIPADDIERAKKFYSLFDWQLQDWPMPDGSVYVGATTTEVDSSTHVPKEPGAINGGIVKRSAEITTPQVTINVPSVDEYIRKVEAAGGRLVKAKQQIGEMGYYAYVTDTEGNLLGLWEDIR
jgi:uncharacterized protein